MHNLDLRKIGTAFFIFLAYVILGKLGLSLAFVNESASAVWAPTGIALASFLILGYRVWPAIMLGAFVVNFTTTNDLPSSLFIAVGNTLEGITGAYLVNKYASGRYAFRRAHNIIKFTIFAAVIAPIVSATMGIITLSLSGLALWHETGTIWFTWWLGDAVGAITVAPVILLFADESYRKLNTMKRKIEAFIFLLAFMGINLLIFYDLVPALASKPTGYLIIPFLVYSAFQFSRKETAFVVLITSCVAIWGTIHGFGPWGELVKEYPNQALLFLQSYTAVIALTTFILSAEILENTQARDKLVEAYNTALEGWSKALDIRDRETEGHTRRVTDLSLKLAKAMNLEEEFLVQIRRGALLHDIGKIFVPDNILFKPGPLNQEEWEIMVKHPAYAYDLLHSTALRDYLDIPHCHHEKWDGSGYPRGLKGAEIPLAARIFSVVDVWDAMRSERSYHEAIPDKEVLEYIRSSSGTHFDPDIVKVFISMMGNQTTAQELPEQTVRNSDLESPGFS